LASDSVLPFAKKKSAMGTWLASADEAVECKH
jgi:hypothetical protein